MQYATLGRTGLRVSRLGFGAMRLPMKGASVDRDLAVPMIHRAFENGVNYIDSAVGYCNQDSQRTVGEALKGWRDRIVVSTKNPHYNKADDRPWWKNLEDSLQRLGVEAIDVYHFHGIRWQTFEEHLAGPDGQLKWMQKAKDQGLIRHIAFSFHDSAEALRKLAETGEFDVVTLQYNLLDRSNEPALGACTKAGLGVVVMGPVGGGRLGSPSGAIQKMITGARSVPEVALRFVLANPDVTVALSGMSEMSHVEENLAVASRTSPLTAAEKRRVASALKRYKKLADLYCTGCNYCMPCPSGVNIPRNFMLLNYARVYDLPDLAKRDYGWMREKATRCLACGKCMSKCPQKIDIIAQLRETVRTLDQAYGKLVVDIRPIEVASLSRRAGRTRAEIRCRLECHNLSDQDVTPELSFAPAEGIEVSVPRGFGRIGPFGRKSVALTVRAKGLADGEPLRLGPALAGPLEMVCGQDPLPVGIAPRASRKSPDTALGRSPLVRAEAVRGEVKPSEKARRAYSVGARFAHDAQGLILKMDARGAFCRPPTAQRPIQESDRVWLSLSLGEARKLRGPKDRPSRFEILLGIPRKASEPVPVRVWRPRLSPEEIASIRAEMAGKGRDRTLTVRIPWSLLKIQPPEPGASLGINFGLVCQTRSDEQPWQLAWGDRTTPTLLFTK